MTRVDGTYDVDNDGDTMTRTDKAMGRNDGGNGVKRWYNDE